MKGIDNDEGIAYGLIAVVMFLLIASMIFICCTPLINGITGHANQMIAEGQIGVQTAGAMEWNLALFAAIPIIGLLGIVAWAYIRSLEER